MMRLPRYLLLMLVFSISQTWSEIRLFPDSSGPAVPVDAPLRITFDQAITFSQKGVLTVYDAGGRNVVYTLDLTRIPKVPISSGWPFQLTVANEKLNFLPMILLEREAYFALPPQTLSPGKTYYVTLDAGAFLDANGQPNPAISDPATWRFTTKALPAPARSGYTIAADGSGDFCTLQGALDFLPAGNNVSVTLSVAPGIYPELIRSIGKNRINIVGADKRLCLIRYTNNDAFNPGTSKRPLARIFGDDIRLENLTFTNATPRGGAQAEALYLRGERCVISDCAFISYQDTMLLEGRAFLSRCEVTGSVDYIWGRGIAYFDHCTLTSSADGYIVQARNQKGAGGYVFNACTLLASGSTAQSYLARDGNGQFPDGQVIWIDTHMGAHIPVTGWLLQAAGGSNPGFGEYHSLDLSDQPIAIGGRSRFSRQLTAMEADYFRTPQNVLGGNDKWAPRPEPSSAIRANGKGGLPATGNFRFKSNSLFEVRGRCLPISKQARTSFQVRFP